MSLEALAQCSEWFVGPAFLVESFVSHPFRKERGKDGAPGTVPHRKVALPI